MIQDIEPSRLDNAFRPGIPEEKDFVLLFDVDGRILVRTGDGKIRFTTGKEVPADGTVYLFSVDGDRYFCALTPAGTALPGFEVRTVRELRDAGSGKELFAAFTAAHNALVAGFTEIGETLEQTVHREVMEETGVRVHNIRYYKSQPWGMAQDLLVGFYCDADEEPVIRMDPNELKYAEWVRREDIVLQPNNLSLTNEMMRMFKEGKKV